jgi:hypothetical protein
MRTPARGELSSMPRIPERAPRDFLAILGADERPLILGGQAANLWADLYAPEVPTLDQFRPFVSKDADIYGTSFVPIEGIWGLTKRGQ